MGKTPQENQKKQQNGKDLLKKMRYTKGTFHAKMGSRTEPKDRLKDRNGMDLTEAEDIRKWQQEYTELYKKRSS